MPDPTGQLKRMVRRERKRRERSRGEHSIGQNLAKAGAFGWLVVVPAVASAYLGRWIDQRLETGILFSAALLFSGAGFGAYMAWTQLMKKEDFPEDDNTTEEDIERDDAKQEDIA